MDFEINKNEIQRGKVNDDYCPDFAQEKYEQSKRAKGLKEKLSIDAKLAQQIAGLILKELPHFHGTFPQNS